MRGYMSKICGACVLEESEELGWEDRRELYYLKVPAAQHGPSHFTGTHVGFRHLQKCMCIKPACSHPISHSATPAAYPSRVHPCEWLQTDVHTHLQLIPVHVCILAYACPYVCVCVSQVNTPCTCSLLPGNPLSQMSHCPSLHSLHHCTCRRAGPGWISLFYRLAN